MNYINCNQNFKISQVNSESLIIGIDIGSTFHFARAFDWRGKELDKTFKFKNSLEGFNSFYSWIKQVATMNNKISFIAGFEPTGHYWFPFGEYLKDNNIQLVMVNPYHVKRTKELDDNLQTKNDLKDPKVIAMLVRDGRFNFPYIPEGIYADLRNMDRIRESIIENINSIKNKIHRWFSIYFPEYKDIYAEIDSKSGLLILKQVSLPKDIAALGADKIVELWKKQKLRAVGIKKAKKLEEAAKNSIGCKNGSSSAKFEIKFLIDEYEHQQEQLKTVEEELKKLCENIPHIEEIAKIKGIGKATATSFVSEIGDIKRFNSSKQLQKYAGLALIENSSGKHKGLTKISKRGRKKLRTILFRVALPLIIKNKEFSSIYSYYLDRKDNPLKKKQALIAICCKLIRVFYAILSKGIKYDEKKLLEDIKRPARLVA